MQRHQLWNKNGVLVSDEISRTIGIEEIEGGTVESSDVFAILPALCLFVICLEASRFASETTGLKPHEEDNNRIYNSIVVVITLLAAIMKDQVFYFKSVLSLLRKVNIFNTLFDTNITIIYNMILYTCT